MEAAAIMGVLFALGIERVLEPSTIESEIDAEYEVVEHEADAAAGKPLPPETARREEISLILGVSTEYPPTHALVH